MRTTPLSRLLRLAAAGLTALVVAACGGGGNGTPTEAPAATTSPAAGTAPTKAQSVGVASVAGGTLHVNGVAWATSAATVVRINGTGASLAALRPGMVARVSGVRLASGDSVAEEVEVENEVIGTVTAVNGAATPKSFDIGAQNVVVGADTRYSDLPHGFDSLAAGVRVEVYGLRDAAGVIAATRVEGLNVPEQPDELKGVVAELNATTSTFRIGAVTVNYAGATFAPAGANAASLVNGIAVEVDGSFNAAGTVFTATRVAIEDNAPSGSELEIEGFIAQFTPGNGGTGTFRIDAQAVRFDGTTRYRGGTAAQLANGAFVEVEGLLLQGTLLASMIAFKTAPAEPPPPPPPPSGSAVRVAFDFTATGYGSGPGVPISASAGNFTLAIDPAAPHSAVLESFSVRPVNSPSAGSWGTTFDASTMRIEFVQAGGPPPASGPRPVILRVFSQTQRPLLSLSVEFEPAAPTFGALRFVSSVVAPAADPEVYETDQGTVTATQQ